MNLAEKTEFGAAASDRAAGSRPVLFVPCPVEPEDYAGWMFQIRSLAESLSGRFDCRLLYRRPGERGGHLRRSLGFALRSAREIRREPGIAAVLFPAFYLPCMLLALLLPRRIGYAVRISGKELIPGNRLSFALRSRLLRRARAVVVLNRDGLDRLAELGVAPDRQIFVPNAVAARFRPPDAVETEAARRALGIGAGEVAIGSVGTLCHRKRQHLILEAVAGLGRRDVTVVFCGPETGHPEADPAYAEGCRALAARHGLRAIFTGRLGDVRGVLWALDGFVLASDSEGMPNALLEAMACGVPSLATDIPGARDIVEHDRSGLLFGRDSAGELGGHLARLLSEPSLRDALSEAARRRIETGFTPDRTVSAYAGILERIVTGAGQ